MKGKLVLFVGCAVAALPPLTPPLPPDPLPPNTLAPDIFVTTTVSPPTFSPIPPTGLPTFTLPTQPTVPPPTFTFPTTGFSVSTGTFPPFPVTTTTTGTEFTGASGQSTNQTTCNPAESCVNMNHFTAALPVGVRREFVVHFPDRNVRVLEYNDGTVVPIPCGLLRGSSRRDVSVELWESVRDEIRAGNFGHEPSVSPRKDCRVV
ncbi:MAG: uncharacterized protein KVP18_004231 [Porospora cf. gigantea A]|uniref:uncharacterized protein n=1 Tax=Porospora cf. gigantea A TaxID=2853593 RepID=UPI003559E6B5|nr:MAG: hypothetical protein KVP18_004231 [Porospora cf. gigantea A]